MSTGIVNIILFLGAAQGILLAVLIFHKYRRLFANRFLGFMNLLYAVIFLHLVLMDLRVYEKHPYLAIIPTGLPLLGGPLHFLYAKYLIHFSKKFRKTDWLHFVVFLLYELYLLSSFFKPGPEIGAELYNIYSEGLPLKYIIFNWLLTGHLIIYMLLTISLLKRYVCHIKYIFSTIEKIKLDWLRNITYTVLILMIVFLIENLFLLLGINLSNFFNLTALLGGLAVYVMGYFGLFKSEIFAESDIADSISQLTEFGIVSPTKRPASEETESKRYEKSGLSPEKATQYLADLLEVMQTEKLYKNSELTLAHLAQRLSISPHNLSEVLNTQLNQNFFDFINQYRVEAVKKELADPGKQHLKILALAFEAGFNSKTAFNTIFKKYTNLTPSEYRNQALQPK